MRLFYRGIKTVGVIACCVFLFWGRSKFSASFSSPISHKFQFFGFFSRGQKAKIKGFFSEQLAQKPQPLRNICGQLKKRFPSMEVVQLKHEVSNRLLVSIKSVTPAFMTNERFVLSDSGLLFHQVLFEKDFLKNLKHLSCSCLDIYNDDILFGDEQLDHSSKLPAGFLQTIKQIPVGSFDRYAIVCEDKKKWCLQDKTKKNFSILCTDETISDQRLICACNKVKGALCERDSLFERGVRPWVADARFANQIILFRKPGGR